MKQADKKISFNDFSDGLNEIDNPISIGDKQMASGSFNLTPTRMGLKRRRAFIKTTTDWLSGRVNGVFSIPNELAYLVNAAGMYDVAGSYSHELSTDTTTFTAGLGICDYSENTVFFAGKKNVLYCDVSSSSTKLDTIGMPSLSSFSAELTMGSSSLISGEHSIKVSYSKKGSTFGQYWSRSYDVALTVNDTYKIINITPPDATYQQPTHFTIWIKAPGESVHYSYGDYDTFGGSDIVISDYSNKDQSLIYEVEVGNNVSPEFDYGGVVAQNYFGMCVANKQLFIAAGTTTVDNKKIIYSRKATSQADYFKFDDDAYIIYPFKIYALFSLGQHLYISTEGGLIRQPYGDKSNEFEYVDRNVYFLSGTTLQKYKGRIVGITNAGIRIFDGSSFSASLSDSVNTDYIYNNSISTPIGSFIALDWFNAGEVSYHWGVWDSGNYNYHYAISLDRALELGYSPVVRYDITMLTGFHINGHTYLVQSGESTPHIVLDRGETGTGTAKDSNVIKSTALSKVSTYVDFALYSKRKYLSGESTMRARELRIVANKRTNNENACGVTAQIKAYSL